ncbi:flagellar export chaperone FliS [Curtobacterium sp. MCJR17_043]|uniref:flagellar export chaperone FliS n=1 Tax=Curtobacterium sp. MCJR17_043 TaxID=2175660 RepID=UPI0032E8EF4F
MNAYDLSGAAAFRQAATPRSVTEQRRAQYTNEAVLSATPAQLVTMLYDRLLLDLHRAETAQVASDWDAARDQLMHAQAIVGGAVVHAEDRHVGRRRGTARGVQLRVDVPHHRERAPGRAGHA